FLIRFADENDASQILSFIKELASYEKMLDQVVATEEDLYKSLFVKNQAKVIIGEYKGEPASFALFFYNYSTFLGKANLYLEDLFVKEAFRSKGIGQAMLKILAKIAVDEGCGRVDWWCLTWNDPAIGFYKKIGAVPMSDWTVFRLQENALKDLAK
ncbi:MAG: GNAT family N-acetyltransferase, partial [Bacillota bacterium]|nr:GNAT family N-acetyltransferase [Bacillota bacterium]